ncbi:MAG: hypothetical protein DSZ31_01365 [Gammaproteobacteria bacterium]|nr:MAG: hypothetical protein DSZ31_01365 [Gammaproteobacteria bacterium]
MVAGNHLFVIGGGNRPKGEKNCKVQKFVYNSNTTAGRFFRNTRRMESFLFPALQGSREKNNKV